MALEGHFFLLSLRLQLQENQRRCPASTRAEAAARTPTQPRRLPQGPGRAPYCACAFPCAHGPTRTFRHICTCAALGGGDATPLIGNHHNQSLRTESLCMPPTFFTNQALGTVRRVVAIANPLAATCVITLSANPSERRALERAQGIQSACGLLAAAPPLPHRVRKWAANRRGGGGSRACLSLKGR